MTLDLSEKTILVVDDERFSRSIVEHLLDSMEKPTVVQAINGSEALDAMMSESYEIDFIIADINMPVMNGLQLLKAIRVGNRHLNRATPVAMLTGFSDKGVVDTALALDVNAFLIKPVSKLALEKRLSQMLRHTDSDIWLKSEKVYMNIDVETVLGEIGAPIQQDTHQKFKQRGVFTPPADQPLFIDPSLEDTEPDSRANEWAHALEEEVSGSERVVETSMSAHQIPGKLYALENIRPGSVLARDVHTADGRLFMHAGAKVTQRIISILFDLQELEHPVDNIWIAHE